MRFYGKSLKFLNLLAEGLFFFFFWMRLPYVSITTHNCNVHIHDPLERSVPWRFLQICKFVILSFDFDPFLCFKNLTSFMPQITLHFYILCPLLIRVTPMTTFYKIIFGFSISHCLFQLACSAHFKKSRERSKRRRKEDKTTLKTPSHSIQSIQNSFWKLKDNLYPI